MGLYVQVKVFMLTVLLGLIAGIILQYYQAVANKARVTKYLVYVMDFLLWMLMILLVFSFLLLINQGEIRAYVLIALLLGILLYYRYFAPRLKKHVGLAANATVSAGRTCRNTVIKPIRYISAYVKLFISRLKKRPGEEENHN